MTSKKIRIPLGRWLPAILMLSALSVGAWMAAVGFLKTVDGPITEERIVAQEERLNQPAYDRLRIELDRRAELDDLPAVPADPFQP